MSPGPHVGQERGESVVGAEEQELDGLVVRWIDANVATAPAFLAERAVADARIETSALGLSFHALERRIVEVAEKGTYPE